MKKKPIVISILLLWSQLSSAQTQFEVGKKLEKVIIDLGTNYTRYQDGNGYDVLFYTIDVKNDPEGFGSYTQSIYLHFDKNICIGLDMTFPIVAVDYLETNYNGKYPRLNENEWRSDDEFIIF